MKLPAFLGALLCAAALVPAATPSANAAITRHCTGYIGPRLISGITKNGRRFTSSRTLGGVALGGRGTCRGKAWANDCRRSARSALAACARELWRTRWSRRVPTNVCGSAGTSRPPHGYITSWGAQTSAHGKNKLPGDVKRAMEHTACCVMVPDAREVNFAIYLAIHGDTGCSHNSTLEPIYKADCRALRAQGLCGAPRRKR